MAKKAEKSLVVGLDIGTSKIVAIVGELQTDGSVEVIGLGSHPSRGLRRGVVVDMTSTEQAIQRATLLLFQVIVYYNLMVCMAKQMLLVVITQPDI
jgi:cell division ATPase FtsA